MFRRSVDSPHIVSTDAVEAITAALDRRRNDLVAWEAISRDTALA